MALAQKKITEHDVVALKRPVGKWPAGTQGTVLSEHGSSKLVEISDDEKWGETLDLLDVVEEDLELIKHYPSQTV